MFQIGQQVEGCAQLAFTGQVIARFEPSYAVRDCHGMVLVFFESELVADSTGVGLEAASAVRDAIHKPPFDGSYPLPEGPRTANFTDAKPKGQSVNPEGN